jgi:ubiquinone/menaquinone biosynthesis C-methylase UbiE
MTEESERNHLRTMFDEVAELYDRVRPTYPPELFDDLFAAAGLRPGARVLEIGCGTGKATLPLAARGLDIVCVELGAELARIARRNLASFPRVQVVHAQFEAWDSGAASFDAVVAFTAFHWLDPAVAYEKPRRLLTDDGALAVVTTHHVCRDDADSFWADVEKDYVAVGMSAVEEPPPRPEEVGDLGVEIDASGRFRTTAVHRYVWDVTYGVDEYVAVLDTYSGHRALSDETRARLYALIRARIEATPNRTVTKSYLSTLNVAKPL